jgi:hypothetical protein
VLLAGPRRRDGTPEGFRARQRDHPSERLHGFKDEAKDTSKSVCGVVVDDEVKLQQAAKRNPNAVAFGYVAGEWIAAA